jgi:hypothetical protein
MPLNKPYSQEITQRFLEEAERIIKEGEMTNKAFAESLDVKQSNIARMGTPGNYVTLEMLAKFCELYGVSSEYLITGNDPRPVRLSETDIAKRLRKIEGKVDQLIKQESNS